MTVSYVAVCICNVHMEVRQFVKEVLNNVFLLSLDYSVAGFSGLMGFVFSALIIK